MSTIKEKLDKSVLTQFDRKHLIHPQHHPVEYTDPHIWVSGKGIYLTNIEGNAYIDGLSGMWNVYVGHQRKELIEAAEKQYKQLAFSTAYAGATNINAIELVKKLKQIVYPSIEAFYFTLGGSDATDTSVRTARFYWKAKGKNNKLKIIATKTGYHGSTVGAASVTGVDEFSSGFGPRVPGIIHINFPNPYRNPYNDIPAGIAAASLLEQTIIREGADTIAAFIAEPIQGGGGGILIPPPDYFKYVRDICTHYNILFISDEVITGFGRTGKWFALEHWNVQPDIVQFAKGITSGYFPLGGIGISDEIKRVLDEVEPSQRWWHGYTCSAHPVACAVALANLDVIENNNLVEHTAELGKRLNGHLEKLYKYDIVGNVRVLGLLAGIELVPNQNTKEAFPESFNLAKRLKHELFKRGLYTRVLDQVICLAPPLVTTQKQIDQIALIVKEAIEVVDLDWKKFNN